MNKIKKDFSWKWYLLLVILSEIITIFLTLKIWLDTQNAHDLTRLEVLLIWFLNSLIFLIYSIVEVIKYKKFKANGCNVVANIIVSIFSSIMLSIGVFFLNFYFYAFLDIGFDALMESIFIIIFYLGIGIALVFPVFKHKK